MGELDSYDWWWNVALQGVVGSVIGALGAVGVLLGTLAWERRRDVRASLSAELRALLNVTRELIFELGKRPLPADDVLVERLKRWEREVDLLWFVTRRKDRGLAAIVTGLQGPVFLRGMRAREAPADEKEDAWGEVSRRLVAVEHVLLKAIADPRHYSRMRSEERMRVISEQRED